MRDGDSGRGNPYESEGDELTTDRDIGDVVPTADLDADAAEVVSTPPPASTPEAMEDTTGDEVAADSSSAADLLDEFNEEDEHETPARPTAAAGDLPIANYAELTVPQIVEQASGMSAAAMQQILAYERSHRRRKTLIVKLERLSWTAK